MSFRIHDGIHLPRFVHDMLSACPAAGGGVHHWLFRTARVLHPFFEDKSRIAEMLAKAASGCGREVSESEILSAIDLASIKRTGVLLVEGGFEV